MSEWMVDRIRGEWVHRLVRTKLSKVRRVIAPVHPNMTEIKFVLRNECSTMHQLPTNLPTCLYSAFSVEYPTVVLVCVRACVREKEILSTLILY